MKAKLRKLMKHYGTQKAVAEVLGVTDRTIRGILNDTKEKPYPCGKPLRILIDRTLKDIKIKQLM